MKKCIKHRCKADFIIRNLNARFTRTVNLVYKYVLVQNLIRRRILCHPTGLVYIFLTIYTIYVYLYIFIVTEYNFAVCMDYWTTIRISLTASNKWV